MRYAEKGQMKSELIECGAVALALSLLLGCSEDKAFVPKYINHAPIIASLSDTSATVGDTLRLQFIASDPDGDSLSFSTEILYTWGEIKAGLFPDYHIDARAGTFWFLPHERDVPQRQVIVHAADGLGGYDSAAFVIYADMGS
jgi:hypothetical protein